MTRSQQGTQGTLARTHGESPGLPRGRTPLPRGLARAAHRDRLLRAMVAATAEMGYAAVTIADVVRRARVSRNVFYDHFADKEECFLAANAGGSELMFATIARAARAPGRDAEPADRLRAALRAYLDFLAREPEFARTFLIDVFAAGPRALEQFVAAQERFAERTRAWHARARRRHPDWPQVPGDAYLALVGAIHQLVVRHVREGRTAQLPELEGAAFDLHVAVLRGWPQPAGPAAA